MHRRMALPQGCAILSTTTAYTYLYEAVAVVVVAAYHLAVGFQSCPEAVVEAHTVMVCPHVRLYYKN
jgi:hypothetical protein